MEVYVSWTLARCRLPPHFRRTSATVYTVLYIAWLEHFPPERPVLPSRPPCRRRERRRVQSLKAAAQAVTIATVVTIATRRDAPILPGASEAVTQVERQNGQVSDLFSPTQSCCAYFWVPVSENGKLQPRTQELCSAHQVYVAHIAHIS